MAAYVVYLESGRSNAQATAAADAMRQIKGVMRVVEQVVDAAETNGTRLEAPDDGGRMAYSVVEAATVLGIGVSKLKEEIYQGGIQSAKFGRRVIVPRWALDERLGKPSTLTAGTQLPASGRG